MRIFFIVQFVFAKTKIIIFSQLRTAAADFSRRAALNALKVLNDLKDFKVFNNKFVFALDFSYL